MKSAIVVLAILFGGLFGRGTPACTPQRGGGCTPPHDPRFPNPPSQVVCIYHPPDWGHPRGYTTCIKVY